MVRAMFPRSAARPFSRQVIHRQSASRRIFGANFWPACPLPLVSFLRALPAWIFSRCCPQPHGTIVGFGAEICQWPPRSVWRASRALSAIFNHRRECLPGTLRTCFFRSQTRNPRTGCRRVRRRVHCRSKASAFPTQTTGPENHLTMFCSSSRVDHDGKSILERGSWPRLAVKAIKGEKMNRLRTIMASLMLSAAAAPLSVLAQPPHGGPQAGEHGHDRGGHHGAPGHGRQHNASGSPGRSAYAPGHWRKGDRLPAEYRGSQYVIDDWRAYNLAPPAPGYRWVGVGDQYLMVQPSSGLVLKVGP